MAVVDAVITAGLSQCISAFAESVVYVPVGGVERTINAIVRRVSNSLVPPTNAYAGPAITITVLNNATTGISSSEIDVGKDNIKVAQRPGLTQQSRPIARIVSVDDVHMTLEVR